MEYALEGYGYSAARMLRGVLANRQDRSEESSHRSIDSLLRMLEDADLSFADDLTRSLSSYLLGDEQPAPAELLSTLASLGPRGPMDGVALRVASATKAAFDAFWQSLKPRITICSIDKDSHGDEHMLLGVYSPQLAAEIRAGDTVAAGVLIALRGEPEGSGYRLEVVPRLYRKICQNGTVVHEESVLSHRIELQRLLGSETVAPLAHALEHAIRDCFDAQVFEAAVDSFRRSANDPLHDERQADALIGGLGHEERQAVLQRYRAEQDFTRWGLLNAITAEARTAPSDSLLRLERLGGKLASQSVARSVYVPRTAQARLASDDMLLELLGDELDLPGMSSRPRAKKATAA